MDKGTYVAVSGSLAQERAMDVIAANLANVSTDGFKAGRVLFESYLQKSLDPNAGIPSPEMIKNGMPASQLPDSAYLVASEGYTDFSQGPLRVTAHPFDIALEGDGFIAVNTPEGEMYTRGGSFMMNLKGELTTKDGHQVLDIRKKPITVGLIKFNIDDAGILLDENDEPIAQIKVVDFPDKNVLQKRGGGLYAAPDSVKPKASTAFVKQGYVESSNINAVTEMTKMITALRTYEAFQKAIQSHDQMTARLIADVTR
ncbi:MAG: flagellar basal-body rod protein FlgF [Nitrospinota bacterium]